MKVLVTFAVDDEFAPWRKLRKFQRIEEEKDVEAYRSSAGGLEICALLTGIGGKKAWVNATRIIWGGDVDFCISSGLAGGLRAEHLVGDSFSRLKLADNINGTNCTVKVSVDSWSMCRERCLKSCDERIYSFEVVDSKQDKEYGAYKSKVTLMHDNMPDTLIVHMPESSFISLVCNLGGLLGMWLGLSVFMLLDTILGYLKLK